MIELGSVQQVTSAATSASGASSKSATITPAIEHIGRSIVILVRDSDIADALAGAARAEGLDVHVAVDSSAALELIESGDHAVLVVEDVPGGAALELARSLRGLPSADRLRVGVVAVGATRSSLASTEATIADWLVWPSSQGYIRTKLRAWLIRQACRWQNAPLPADEAQRVRSLNRLGVLDTDSEARFDQLTQMVSDVLDVPIALVSLVDADRQWFKSKVGIEATETPRDLAFCAHAILDDGVLQVPDVLADERFADNPMVAGDPRLRFYAGAPLTLSDGSKAGTLCVIDYRPRLLSDEQLAELRRLADLVTVELERR